MKVKRPIILVATIIAIIVSFTDIACAHPGRTDAQGGHWNRSTGEYHFHTGEYVGRGSTGNSAKSEHEAFKPPYEPPTKSKVISSTSSKNKITVADVAINTVVALPFVWVTVWAIYIFIARDISKNAGCATMTILVIAGYLLIVYLLENNPWLLLSITIAIAITALGAKILKKITSLTEAKIAEYRRAIEEFDAISNEIFDVEKIINDNECGTIPDEYEIGSDGLPKEKSSNTWGETFTVYTSAKGEKTHAREGCCNARIPTHIFLCKQNFCSKCCKEYKAPDVTWYTMYLKKKKSQEKYRELQVRKDQLRSIINSSYIKCNKKAFKFRFLLKKEIETKLKEANEKYNSVFNGEQVKYE